MGFFSEVSANTPSNINFDDLMNFSYGILDRVWYLIVSIPDLFYLSFFYCNRGQCNGTIAQMFWVVA